MREEGGTPAIIGSIRAGLVVQLKEAIGCQEIMAREKQLVERVFSKWKDIPEVHLCVTMSVCCIVLFSVPTVGCGWSPFHPTAPCVFIPGTAQGQWPIPPSQLCMCSAE